MMTLLEAIQSRHSVRRYTGSPLSAEAKEALEAKILEVNAKGGLHVQLICDEPKAFTGALAYGKFSGVTSYLVMAGRKAVRLAPTAVNQQKFHFEYSGVGNKVIAKRQFSMVGYTQMDMGIAKLHFEIGADRDIEWVDK